ncbi:MAG: biotin carboxylase, partial [Bacteroidota bacterium]|nr:biotin carboxylase [Bacteroidota bacterium]
MSRHKKITIAITGLNAIDSPGPGIAVIRALREATSFDVRIIGLSYESLEPGIYMHDLIDKTYHIPYPSTGTRALLERIEYIHEKENLDLIIPNFDAELFPFIKIESTLAAMGIHTFLPTLQQFEERHKMNLPEFGKKYGFHVPDSANVFDVNEVQKALNGYDFPILVKGKYYDAHIAYNSDQVISYF